MPVDVAVAVSRSVGMRHRWQIYDLTVSHPSFGDDVIGEFLHVFTGSFQDVTSMQLSWSKWTCNVARARS